MSWNHKKVFTTRSYIKHFLILAPTITGGISTFAFAASLGVSLEMTCYATQ